MIVGPAFFSGASAPVGSAVLLIDFESGIVDESPYGRALTPVNGAAASTTRAKFGSYGMTTDGTYRIDASSAAELQFLSQEWSVDGWLYVPTAASLATDNTIAAKWTTTGGNKLSWWIGLRASGHLRFFFSNDGAYVGSFPDASAAGITRDAWVHFAVWRCQASGTDRVYGAFNGVAYNVHSSSIGTINSNAAPITIAGVDYTTSARLPNGCSLDELRICVGSIDYGHGNFTPPAVPYG